MQTQASEQEENSFHFINQNSLQGQRNQECYSQHKQCQDQQSNLNQLFQQPIIIDSNELNKMMNQIRNQEVLIQKQLKDIEISKKGFEQQLYDQDQLLNQKITEIKNLNYQLDNQKKKLEQEQRNFNYQLAQQKDEQKKEKQNFENQIIMLTDSLANVKNQIDLQNQSHKNQINDLINNKIIKCLNQTIEDKELFINKINSDLKLSIEQKNNIEQQNKQLQQNYEKQSTVIAEVLLQFTKNEVELEEIQNKLLEEQNKQLEEYQQLALKYKTINFQCKQLNQENEFNQRIKEFFSEELINMTSRITRIRYLQQHKPQNEGLNYQFIKQKFEVEKLQLRDLTLIQEEKKQYMVKIQEKRLQSNSTDSQFRRFAEIQIKLKQRKIQLCFLMDLYKQSKIIKNNIILGISEVLNELKSLTGREFCSASHCYGYRKSQFKIPVTQPFTKNTQEILSNLEKQDIEQFIDQPEDIKSAFHHLENFQWNEKFKLAILIPSSPCHGRKYHDPRKYKTWFFFEKEYDKKPNDEIISTIDWLIQKDIILLVIRINDDTKIMCQELEKIYQSKNKSHMYWVFPVVEITKNHFYLKETILKFLITLTSADKTIFKSPTVQEYEINKRGKKNEQKNDLLDTSSIQAKKNKIQCEAPIERIKNYDGDLQALCKSLDIQQFQLRVETVKFRCQSFKVDLKEQSFETKKQNIQQILFEENDYNVEKVNDWDCIRTKNPFAFGIFKEVYLMKRNGSQDEIYIVKIPIDKGCYQSMKDAVNDCRSHLVAKNLMKIFMDRISKKILGQPQIVYTDILLLQEIPSIKQQLQDKIWLAEKFVEGKFEKYNSNDGFILDIDAPLNQLAQAFSYFTYQEGGFNYIVNDIQGVNNQFTDPTINTTKGDSDETDAGEQGICNYLVSLQTRKHLCEMLLKSIDIDMD